jgi:predicted AlkP superfamily phosphohydrolase/phosphomutase
MIAVVLALISLDATALPLLERMIVEGRLPNYAELRRRGKTYEMKASPIHASVYRSLYTGLGLSTHGVHYPLQWCAAEQCVRPADALNPDDSIFARLERAGRRILVIDPPECGLFTPRSGIAISGWQFTTRFVLPRWYSSKRVARVLEDRFGRSHGCHEVFGRPSISRLRAMHEILQSAPRRLTDTTLACLKTGEFDFLWITFVAAHIAGHQMWRESLDSSDGIGREPEVLAGIYERVDHALGDVVAALPPSTDVIVFSPNGMGPETSRADLLPEMLARVLEGRAQTRTTALPTSALWRLRAAVPTNLRALVADALPDHLALRIAARLESTGADWKTTRAFAPPSDGAGFVRLNLKGREREGIVHPDEAESLLKEIAAGLATFVEPSGQSVVGSVVRPCELDGPGPRSESLPDLVVVWQQSAATLRSVASPRFGEVRRAGVGSGRSGNHCGATWATVVPGTTRAPDSDFGPVGPVDLAATVCAMMGVDHDDLPGRSLFN